MAEHAHTTPATLARKRHARTAPGSLDRRPAAAGPPPGYTRRQGTIRPTATHFLDGVYQPDVYGCPLKGDCLVPEILDGDMGLASPSAPPVPGDFVVLYFASGSPPQMKRLVMAAMFPVGTKLHPDSDVMPVVMVEMLNPPRQLSALIDRLAAMHKVVGLIRASEVDALRNLPPMPAPVAAKRRRKAGGL